MRSAPLTHLLDGDIFYRTVRFIVHRRSGWGHILPSQSPATSDCLRFVFRSFGVDELMAVYGTHRLCRPVG